MPALRRVRSPPFRLGVGHQSGTANRICGGSLGSVRRPVVYRWSFLTDFTSIPRPTPKVQLGRKMYHSLRVVSVGDRAAGRVHWNEITQTRFTRPPRDRRWNLMT